jgi:hypothetical protein
MVQRKSIGYAGPMRNFWLSFGWLAAIGSVVDALIVIYAIIVIAAEPSYSWALSSEVLFRDHLAWLYWIKQLAYLFLDANFIDWIFGLPTIVLFTVRIVVSGIIGKWAFTKAQQIEPGVAT